MSGVWVVVLFLVLILLRLPLAFSMAVPAVIYLLAEGIPLSSVVHRMVNAVNSFTLLAVPLFIFAGNLMNYSGMTDRIFKFVLVIVGRIRGGLAQVNILSSLAFSGISGSALADIGGLGKIMIRAMNKAGYDPKISAGLTAASATVGPIFPPSIPIIIYAVVAEVPAARLLLSGIVPALLVVAIMMIQVAWMAKKYNYPREENVISLREKAVTFGKAFPALLTPVILIVGLLTGVFGPTELAAFTVLYIVVLGKFVYRELTWEGFMASIKETVRSTAVVMIIISAAAIFAWTLTVSRLTQDVTQFLLGISTNPTVLLFIVAVLLLIVGCLLESVAAILIITPLVAPPLVTAGVDPIHLGLIVVFTLMIGLLTPPVGMSLFMTSSIANMPLEQVVRGTAPFLFSLLITLVILILFPPLSIWLPSLIMK